MVLSARPIGRGSMRGAALRKTGGLHRSIDEAKSRRAGSNGPYAVLPTEFTVAERRAHIVLSCRLTDWEATRDLER